MDVPDGLMAIEERLWSGGPEAVREHIDDTCMLVFSEMVGVWPNEEIARSVDGGDRWRDVAMSVEGVLSPAPDVVLVTYRASAVRGEDERYSSLASSGYVRKDGAWRMVFHQQTPLDGA